MSLGFLGLKDFICDAASVAIDDCIARGGSRANPTIRANHRSYPGGGVIDFAQCTRSSRASGVFNREPCRLSD